MIPDTCWLPELEYLNDYSSWPSYESVLFSVFKNDFIDSSPIFNSKVVKIRWEPIEFHKPEAFFHVTCQDYMHNNERVPDLRRCERIRWIRAFIENYNCDSSLCSECDGIKVWVERYKNKDRIHLLLEEERYLVVLERRPKYYSLVTAFYLEQEHSLRKKLQKYESYRAGCT